MKSQQLTPENIPDNNHNASRIKQWATDDRPREKLIQKGPNALSDAELLAILIQNGTREKSAVDLAREILGLAGNRLHKLARLNFNALQKLLPYLQH
jgi:DNA repair protein RadC